MKKHIKILTVAAMGCLLTGALLYTGCKKAQLEQTNSDYAQLIAAQNYSNNELVHLIKHEDPPLSDHELMGIMIAASPLDDNIIKELLKRGQPPANAPLSDETLQMILLFNLPLSDHILNELDKANIALYRGLVNDIELENLPDMELDKANLLMESLLNLKFGDGSKEFHKIEPVTSTFQVQGMLQSGQYFVLAQEFVQTISDLVLSCGSAPGTITTPCVSKHIRAVDLEIITSVDPITGNKVFDVKLTIIVALELPQPAGPKCYFGLNDYWKAYGATNGLCGGPNNGGYCGGPYNGQHTSSDAAEQVEILLNTGLSTNYCEIPIPCEILIGLEQKYRFSGMTENLNNQDPVLDDNKYDFLMFYSINDPLYANPAYHHECLSPTFDPYPAYPAIETNEAEFYRKGTRFYANSPVLKPQGKAFIGIDLWGCNFGPLPGGYYEITHGGYFYYAKECAGLPVLLPEL